MQNKNVFSMNVPPRFRQNTLSARVLWRTAEMNGAANRVEARKSEDGLTTTRFR
jgi:hypothetical protein